MLYVLVEKAENRRPRSRFSSQNHVEFRELQTIGRDEISSS